VAPGAVITLFADVFLMKLSETFGLFAIMALAAYDFLRSLETIA